MGLEQTAVSTRRVFSFFKRYWGAFQERRKRQRLRATLCDLSDRELKDIGTTRGEIDYVASNRGIDPRGGSDPPDEFDIFLLSRAISLARWPNFLLAIHQASAGYFNKVSRLRQV